MRSNVGIVGLGMDVPSDVRTNAWWPAGVVASWAGRGPRAAPPLPAALKTTGTERVLAGMAAAAADPFQGVTTRRVLPAGDSVFDMEERAARAAIERAGIDPARIGLLLTHTVVPDYQLANTACVLHHRLGLATDCLAMHTEATANTILGQLALAEAAIAAGRIDYAVLTQSSVATRLMDRDDPSSVVLGDGATAVVLGAVSGERGVRSMVHRTDGRYPRSLIMSVPNARWYDEGRARVHVGDPQQLFEAQVQIADVCKASVEAALARAGYGLADVGFWAVFQGTAWMEAAVLDHLGVRNRKPVSVFPRFGYLSSAAIPAALYLAVEEGQLVDDDLVVLTGGGTGMTYGAAVLRWGTS